MILIKKFYNSLEQGLTKDIFDHVRNYLMCAFLIATGSYAMKYGSGGLLGVVTNEYTGIGIIALGFILALLNLYDGILRLSKFKHHLFLDIVLILLYIFISERIIEISWGFRLGL